MRVLNWVQGSKEWLDGRKEHDTASEASAMMSASKYQSRNALLAMKKTGIQKPVDKHTQRIFDLGHKYEDKARLIVSMEQCEELPALVGCIEIDGLKLLASFDGLTDTYCWEHKSWNKTLAENVTNGVLEPHYYWQLEQQCLVAGLDQCLFTVSDGTEEKMISMWYESVPSRQADLIAGWKQFNKDLESFEIKAKTEVLAPTPYGDLLPAVTFNVEGTELTTNIGSCLVAIKDLAESEMNKKLESDQDFADKDQLNKDVKKARAALKDTLISVQGKFVSYSDFAGVAADLDTVLQKMQSQGEKQVKQEKEARKQAILSGGGDSMNEFFSKYHGNLNSDVIHSVASAFQPDFITATKGKRTIESLQCAVDGELARCKAAITPLLDVAIRNLDYYNENSKGFEFLFRDINQLLTSSVEAFTGLVKGRISDHKQAEAEREEQQREKIRIEEAAKAKVKAENEAKALAETERVRIRNEEQSKARTEQLEALTPAEDPAPVVVQAPVVEQAAEVVQEQVEVEAVQNTASEVAEQRTMLGDINKWADKYQISQAAYNELGTIINQYV